MHNVIKLLVIILMSTGCAGVKTYNGSASDQAAMKQTHDSLGAAFARGDVAAVLAYHHPDVKKALGYNKYPVGRDELKKDLEATFAAFTVEFVENKQESMLFNKGTIIKQSLFTIRGTPKKGGEPFIFKGRSMVVYVRYKGSPSGWASIREVVQPAK